MKLKALALAGAIAALGGALSAGEVVAQNTGQVFQQTEQALRAKLKNHFAGQPARFGFENFRRRTDGKQEAVCGQATIYIGRDKPKLVRFVYRYNNNDGAIETLSSDESRTVQALWNSLCLRGQKIE